jgi:hypothetical protein
MSGHGFTESVVEEAALAWLENLGYAIKHGPEITRAGDTSPSPSPRRPVSFVPWNNGQTGQEGAGFSLAKARPRRPLK